MFLIVRYWLKNQLSGYKNVSIGTTLKSKGFSTNAICTLYAHPDNILDKVANSNYLYSHVLNFNYFIETHDIILGIG